MLHFLHARDADFDTAVRCQAGDQLILALDAVTLGAGDRVGFTTAFDGDLAGVVGAPLFHAHQSQHRAVLNDAFLIGRQHGWQQRPGQLVPTKKITLELSA